MEEEKKTEASPLEEIIHTGMVSEQKEGKRYFYRGYFWILLLEKQELFSWRTGSKCGGADAFARYREDLGLREDDSVWLNSAVQVDAYTTHASCSRNAELWLDLAM